MYSNVGFADRLDFTVIGPAVNLAFRLEALTKDLGFPVLVSRAFSNAAGTHVTRFASDTRVPRGRGGIPEYRTAMPASKQHTSMTAKD